MMMKRWMVAAALFAMSAGAHADDYTFDSITELSVSGSPFTGVLVNDTVPTTLSVNMNTTAEKCFSWMQLMMTHPGMFTLTVSLTINPPSGGFPGSTVVSTCRLSAKS